MKEIEYTRMWQVKQYEPLTVNAKIERHPKESLEHFIARSLKEFAMLITNAQVLRQK